ncbi:MAG: hypothetical protein B7X45_02885 [Lysobacterales bacterium 15-68-25]|nr:MAG: hypothetical protein B7X45_02885 [Xanthomonadales bacterium 15-68-25]
MRHASLERLTASLPKTVRSSRRPVARRDAAGLHERQVIGRCRAWIVVSGLSHVHRQGPWPSRCGSSTRTRLRRAGAARGESKAITSLPASTSTDDT